MLFYANIFGLGGVCEFHGISSYQGTRLLRLECYSKRLSLVTKEVEKITKTSETPSEELIATVLILSAYNIDAVFDGRTALEPPESDSSAIDAYYYCLTTINYSHSLALRVFVVRVGGIDSVQTQGIAHLICL